MKEIRNILSHRLASSRTLSSYGVRHADGTYTSTTEEFLNILGSEQRLSFDEELLDRQLHIVNDLLIRLVAASLEFLENYQPVKPEA